MFQSTRPRGARRLPVVCVGSGGCFNPRAHAGRDNPGSMPAHPSSWFQSTRPRGARRVPGHRAKALFGFQSTRPRGARRGQESHLVPLGRLFQSTRPRGARRQSAATPDAPPRVSIHAPTRGATAIEPCGTLLRILFQSTRPRGARQAPRPSDTRVCSFNPRAHAGRDPRSTALMGEPFGFQSTRPRGARLHTDWSQVRTDHVSIHAPTRGATRTNGTVAIT